ncbi:hypothetical protein L1887_27698 [Cichorium endivia]|nr:hypothetical protein L1887_27698 [Cichorium endivia]
MVQRSNGGAVIAKVEAVTSDGGFTVILLWYSGGVGHGSIRDRRRDIRYEIRESDSLISIVISSVCDR